MPDHVHMLISISPKYSAAQIIVYLRGNTNSVRADTLSRLLAGDEEMIRAYIKNQELFDRQLDQFELKISAAQSPIKSKHTLRPPLAVPNQTSSLLEVIGLNA
jgi:hypothetical protein